MPLAVQFNFDPRCGYEYNLNFGLAMDFNGKTRDNYMITYSPSVSCFENILGTKAVYFFAEQWSDSVPKVSKYYRYSKIIDKKLHFKLKYQLTNYLYKKLSSKKYFKKTLVYEEWGHLFFNFVIFCVNKKVIIVVENLGTF